MRANYIFTQVIISLLTKWILERSPREIPVSIKDNFIAEVKDLQQQGIIEKVTEPTEWVSAPTIVNKPAAKNGISGFMAVSRPTDHTGET